MADAWEQYPTATGTQWRLRDPSVNGDAGAYPPQERDERAYDDWVPPAQPEDDRATEDGPTTWEPVDLGPWLRGEIEVPKPSMGITRSDGLKIIYPGCEHVFFGATESGKSWLVLGCVLAELTAGNHVVYVHYEEGPANTVERLTLLGVDAGTLAARLHFVGPARPARKEWVESLLTPVPTLVVHDGVNEAMSLHGDEIKDPSGASSFRRRLVLPFLRVGAASIACDHTAMSHDATRRDAIGSVHKGNALDGARFLLQNTAPFGRTMRGVSHVFVTKDRPGWLRARGRPSNTPGKTLIGTLVVDDSDPFTPLSAAFYAPREGDTDALDGDPSAALANTVHDVIAAMPDRRVRSMRMLLAEMRRSGHRFGDRNVMDSVDDLIVDGRVIECPGDRGAKGYEAVATAATTAANGDSE